MVRLVLQLLIVTTVVTGFGCDTFARSTSEVWQRHIEAWEARDLDAIAADYSEGSVLILNNEVFEGLDAIKQVFAQLFDLFNRGVGRIDDPTIHKRIVFITWHFTPLNDREFFGTDTFIVERGKITVQTIASALYENYPIDSQ